MRAVRDLYALYSDIHNCVYNNIGDSSAAPCFRCASYQQPQLLLHPQQPQPDIPMMRMRMIIHHTLFVPKFIVSTPLLFI